MQRIGNEPGDGRIAENAITVASIEFFF